MVFLVHSPLRHKVLLTVLFSADRSNITFSIDLSKSWKPTDVQLQQIPKPESVPTTPRQAYFLDASSNTVYTWGGFIQGGPRPVGRSGTRLGKFVAAADGGGIWSEVSETDSIREGLAGLTRSHGGAVASTPDAGFYFGGLEEETDVANSGYHIPNYFQFNYKSQGKAWVSHTDDLDGRFSTSRTIYAASAHYVSIGKNGLIVLIGGGFYNYDTKKSENLPMGTLWLLDPVTNKWYYQVPIGDLPTSRRWPCTVGARSHDGTSYEM